MRKGTPPSIKALSLNKELILKKQESLVLPGTFSTLAQLLLWQGGKVTALHQVTSTAGGIQKENGTSGSFSDARIADLFFPLACPAVPCNPNFARKAEQLSLRLPLEKLLTLPLNVQGLKRGPRGPRCFCHVIQRLLWNNLCTL